MTGTCRDSVGLLVDWPHPRRTSRSLRISTNSCSGADQEVGVHDSSCDSGTASPRFPRLFPSQLDSTRRRRPGFKLGALLWWADFDGLVAKADRGAVYSSFTIEPTASSMSNSRRRALRPERRPCITQ